MNFWPYQNLAYFCATKNESIPPILTLPLPDPSGYILSTDVDAFVNGSGSAKVLEMVEWRHCECAGTFLRWEGLGVGNFSKLTISSVAEYPELEEIQLVAQIIPPSQSADSAGSGEL